MLWFLMRITIVQMLQTGIKINKNKQDKLSTIIHNQINIINIQLINPSKDK